MQRSIIKKITTIAIILIVIAIIFVVYLILNEKQPTQRDDGTPSLIGSFFPFGNRNSSDNEFTNNQSEERDDADIIFPRLRKLISAPTAGATAFQRGNDIVVRYVEKNTGHVYEILMSEVDGTRLINRTIPRIHDAVWERSGGQVIMRYIDENRIIKSYSTVVPDIESETFPVGNFIDDNIEELHASRSSSNILYLSQKDGTAYGIKSDFNNNGRKQLFSSPFQEWLLDWPNDATIVATPKPSYNVEGHTYLVDIENNTFKKILGNKPALLSKMNPYQNKILFSTTGDSGHSFGVFNITDNKELFIALKTTPEKCIWSSLNSFIAYCTTPTTFNDTNFPDIWYKGQISFSDSGIWTINTATLELSSHTLSEWTNEPIDAIKFFMDQNETYLYFFNKKDDSLWSFELKPMESVNIENPTNVSEHDISKIPFSYNDSPTQNQKILLTLLTEDNLGTINWMVTSEPQDSNLVLNKSSDNKSVTFTATEVGNYKIVARSASNNTEKTTNFNISPVFPFDESKIKGNDGSISIDRLIGIIINQSWVNSRSLSEKEIRKIVENYNKLTILGYDDTFGLLVEYDETEMATLEAIEELKFEKGIDGVRNRVHEGENVLRAS